MRFASTPCICSSFSKFHMIRHHYDYFLSRLAMFSWKLNEATDFSLGGCLDESIATVGSGMSLNSFHIPHLLFFRSFLANFSFHQFIFPFQHSISAVVDRLESRCHHPSVVHSPPALLRIHVPNSLSFPSLLCRLRSCGTTQFSILHEHTRSKTQETVYKWDTWTEYCAKWVKFFHRVQCPDCRCKLANSISDFCPLPWMDFAVHMVNPATPKQPFC